MRLHKGTTRGLIFTSTFWLLNYCYGWLGLMSYSYVLVGFGAAALVTNYNDEDSIPEWFTFLIAPCVALGAWLLVNFPLWLLLAVLALQVHSVGGFQKATHTLLDLLLQSAKAAHTHTAPASVKPGIALVMNSGASSQADMARTLGPANSSSGSGGRSKAAPRPSPKSLSRGSRSFKVDNISQLLDIRPAAAEPAEEIVGSKGGEPQQGIAATLVMAAPELAAAAPAPETPPAVPALSRIPSLKMERSSLARLKSLEQEEHSSSAASEDSTSEADSPAAPSRPPRKFPSLPAIFKQPADDSDSTSDSDYGGTNILRKRGLRNLHLPQKFPPRSGRPMRTSRFGGPREAAAEVHHEDSRGVKRSLTSPVDHNVTSVSARSTAPKQVSYPELPDVFRDKFMLKASSLPSSEARNKFMRSETARSVSLG